MENEVAPGTVAAAARSPPAGRCSCICPKPRPPAGDSAPHPRRRLGPPPSKQTPANGPDGPRHTQSGRPGSAPSWQSRWSIAFGPSPRSNSCSWLTRPCGVRQSPLSEFRNHAPDVAPHIGTNVSRVGHGAQDGALRVTGGPQALRLSRRFRSQISFRPVRVSRSSTSSTCSQNGTIASAKPPVAIAVASSVSSSRRRPRIPSTWPAKP